MKLPMFDYLAPQSLGEACAFLQKMGGRAVAIAGGTDLMPSLKEKLKLPEFLVDLRNIPDLAGISYCPKEGLQIGALVSLRHLAAEPLVKQHYPALARAALEVASAQIRAMGTVGGNICQDCLCLYYNRANGSRHGLERCHKAGGDVCHTVKGSRECWATYCSDLAPVLLALGTQLKVTDSTGVRMISLNELYSGDGKCPHSLRPGQLVTRILIPPARAQSGAVYLKLRARRAIDYPALGVAVSITSGESGRRVALGLTGVEKRPLLIEEIIREGCIFSDEDIERMAEKAYRAAHPLNNLRDFTPNYRRNMTRVYVRLAFAQALRLVDR